jgi:hypothetical protein
MFQQGVVMANVLYELYIDDIQSDENHQLTLSASIVSSWKDEDGQDLDSMTFCLETNLTESVEAMFLMADRDVDHFPIDEVEDSIHTLHVLESQFRDLRERLETQLKKKKERN